MEEQKGIANYKKMKQSEVAQKTGTSRQNVNKKAKLLEVSGQIKDRRNIAESELHYFVSNPIKKIEQPSYKGEVLLSSTDEERKLEIGNGQIKKLQHWILEEKKYSAKKKQLEAGKLELEKKMQEGILFPREIVFECASIFYETLSRELRKFDVFIENHVAKSERKKIRKGIAEWISKSITEVEAQMEKVKLK